MYEGVSVFLSASVTDMMELFLDDEKKIKHASFSEVTSWSVAGCCPLWHTTQDKTIESCIPTHIVIYKSPRHPKEQLTRLCLNRAKILKSELGLNWTKMFESCITDSTVCSFSETFQRHQIFFFKRPLPPNSWKRLKPCNLHSRNISLRSA